MISKVRPDYKEEVIDKYLNMNLIFDVGTNNKRRGNLANLSRWLDGRVIGRLHNNPLFDTREYEI